MLDFFVISLSDVLTTLRVLFLITTFLLLMFFLVWFLAITCEAFSCFRFISNAVDYKAGFFGQLKDSYRVILRDVHLTNNLDYWKSSRDWRYYDKRADKWVLSKDAKEPVYNQDEGYWES